MRHEEPIFIKEWRKAILHAPKCCHTCDYYNSVGRCTQFDMSPPSEFAAEVNVCDLWERMVPF